MAHAKPISVGLLINVRQRDAHRLASRVPTSTAEGPSLWRRRQVPLHRILVHVVQLLPRLVTSEHIEVVLLGSPNAMAAV